MSHAIVTLQNVSNIKDIPSSTQIERWVNDVLNTEKTTKEVCIRIVDEVESAHLNQRYRNKNKPTNVLAFPMELPADFPIEEHYLGDLVICANVLAIEAKQQHKSLESHWAHIIIHGCLHLLGFDHQEDDEAQIMEDKEVEILKQLGYPNPYG